MKQPNSQVDRESAYRAVHCLFSTESVRSRFDKMLRFVTNSVKNMEGDEILACDIEATVIELMKPYRFEFPAINESAITANVDPPTPLSPHAPYLTRFFIPFSGEAEILRMQPTISPPPGSPPRGRVQSKEIQITLENGNPDPMQVRSHFEQTLNKINQYLQVLASEMEHEFNELAAKIKHMLLQRREQLERAGRVARDLGYPLQRRENPSGMAVPVQRKTIPVVVPPASPKPVAMEPYLEEAIYSEVLNVLASMSLLIERNRKTFAHVDEPTLRDHFLLQLNGQFEGNATGETFNGEGKTDILLREQDKNLFIAECKFWNGQQSLVDAIDQLFGYATWRDSKAVILVFSRRKDFSRTVEEAGKALRGHSQFRGANITKRETSFRAWMARRDDEQRRIDLTVMLFNIPSEDSG